MVSVREKKFIVVTGKGGSGKSLLALALAHRLSAEGRRVWLVEVGRKRDLAFTRLPELTGLKAASHKPVEVKLPRSEQKILVSVLDPATSLAEYVDLKLPTGGLAGVLLNNRVTSTFLEVVPGLPDLVSLGKLWHSVAKPKVGSPDVVILDAPASGHAISLLKAPENFRRITKVGPIYRDSAAMAEFFADPTQTAIALTTLPEEMSLQETAELSSTLAKDFPTPLIFVNRCFPDLPKVASESESIPYQAYRYAESRAEREQKAVKDFGLTHVSLPFFFPDPKAPPLYLRISAALP